MPESILIADDEPGIRESLADVLQDCGYEAHTAADGLEAIEKIEKNDFAVVLTDIRMPGADGLEVLKKARAGSPQTIVLVMTAHATVETAVAALREGAADYVLKPIVFEDLIAKVSRLSDHRQLVWEAQVLRREVERDFDFDNLVGKAPAMHEVERLIRKVAPTASTVLITGESGTGKEVVARAIHRHSEVGDRIFLPINCAAIPESLLESQLFGHVKGAFTGAISTQEGLFSRARGGTVFLDEIGDTPLPLQSKLLRAIEAKEILPVGSTKPVTVDVRIIAATHQNLLAMAERGEFREDLYYRLNVVNVQLPPLRDRREDIPDLVEFFIRRHARDMKKSFRGADHAAIKLLMAQPWKGNVRELDNVIEHAMILADGDWITAEDLPASLRSREVEMPVVGDNLRDALRSYERSHIRTVLARYEDDKRAAADALGLSLSSLYRKVDELGLKNS